MKIAVTYENGKVFQHFGHTEKFKIYDVENGKVKSSEVIETNGKGHSALAYLLSSLEVEVLICGGIGGGAQSALLSQGIRIYGGVNGAADLAVEKLLIGRLDYNPNIKCNHHGNEHSCHNHSDGHCGGNCEH